MQDCLLIINVINRVVFYTKFKLTLGVITYLSMTNVVPFKKIRNKTRIKNSIFCHFEKIYRKNNNCRVAMTTTYRSTSCNSENIVACS